MIATRNPEIRKAVNTLYELSADDKVRAEYEQRQKAWRDRKAVYEYMLDSKLSEVARKLKDIGVNIEQIAQGTGLSIEDVSNL